MTLDSNLPHNLNPVVPSPEQFTYRCRFEGSNSVNSNILNDKWVLNLYKSSLIKKFKRFFMLGKKTKENETSIKELFIITKNLEYQMKHLRKDRDLFKGIINNKFKYLIKNKGCIWESNHTLPNNMSAKNDSLQHNGYYFSHTINEGDEVWIKKEDKCECKNEKKE